MNEHNESSLVQRTTFRDFYFRSFYTLIAHIDVKYTYCFTVKPAIH